MSEADKLAAYMRVRDENEALTERLRVLTEAASALADEAETIQVDENTDPDSILADAFYAAVDALRGVLDDHPRGDSENGGNGDVWVSDDHPRDSVFVDPTHCAICYERVHGRGGSV